MKKNISGKIRFIAFCLLCLVFSLCIAAQEQKDSNFNLMAFIPRSPNVMAMERFGTYPINHYTGTAPLSVDFYSMPLSKEFTFNVQLQYHSGGIKVSDVNSWTGTSWSLQAGGCISREVRGMPDDFSQWGFYNNKEIVTPSEISFLTWKQLNQIHPDEGLLKDLEPDIFHFNVNGRSFRFFLDRDKNFRTIPHADIKIVNHPLRYSSDPYSTVDQPWEIIDESGTKYIFRAKEGRRGAVGIHGVTTAWMLYQVISPEGKVLATFDYKHVAARVAPTSPIEEKVTVLTKIENAYEWDQPEHIKLGRTQILPNREYERVTSNQLLTSVTLHDGNRLIFEEGPSIEDGTRLSVLKSVSLKRNEEVLSTYILDYVGFAERDYLKKVTKIADGQSIPLRRFEYNGYMDRRDTYSVDFWGYYNGVSNRSLVPYNKRMYEYQSYEYADRRATAKASTGLIKEIHYPTGGYSKFEFDTNVSSVGSSESYTYPCTSEISLMSSDSEDVEKIPKGEKKTETSRFKNTEKLIGCKFTLSIALSRMMDVLFDVAIKNVNTGQIEFRLDARTIYENVYEGRYNQYIIRTSSNGDVFCRIEENMSFLDEGEYEMSITTTRNTDKNPNDYYCIFYCQYKKICTGTIYLAGPDHYSGGTCISSIKNYDSDNKLLTHTAYSYSPSYSGDILSFLRSYGYRQAFRTSGHGAPSILATSTFSFEELRSSNMNNYSGPHVRYPSVTEHKIDFNKKDTLITKYVYSNFANERYPGNSMDGHEIPMLPYSINDYKGGLLNSKTDYVLHNNKQIPIRVEGYTYSTIGKPITFESIMLYKVYDGISSYLMGPNAEGGLNERKNEEYKYGHYEITSEKQVLAKQFIKDYIYDSGYDKPAKEIITTTNYQYKDNDYIQPEHITTIDSRGQTVKNTIQYCYDINSAVYTEMKKRNIINQPIRKKTYVGSKETESMEYSWDFFNFNKIVELKTALQKAPDGSIQNEVTYHNYDGYGNPVYLSRKGADNMIYLWSYNGKHPVAVILNSTYDKVNKAVSDVGLGSVDQLSQNSEPNKESLDKIRILLSDAYVSTFKYHPTKGLIEQTSPSGFTTYYAYDSFNRLKESYILTGGKREIIESYDYNYSNK